jgi:2-amino-4-hydroxy-6-hydroxymethyldihydropteridine diphosphokinase
MVDPGKRDERAGIYLGFGSNLGRRRDNIRQALALLEQSGISLKAVSSFYLTEPVDAPGQPWFVNAAAEIETPLTPRELLACCLGVESRLKRTRRRPGEPRTIDIDILLFGQRIIREAALTLPHPRLRDRRFVLTPLAEIAPSAMHPVEKSSIATLLKNLACDKQVIRYEA